MKIINATPHAINVVKGGDIVTFQPSGMVARVDMTTTTSALNNLDGFNVSCNQTGDVTGIPPQQDGVYYIVSAVVLGNSTRSDHFNMSAQAPGFRHGDSALFYFAREIKSLKRIFIANFCNIY